MNAACSSHPSCPRIGRPGSQFGPCTSRTAKLAMPRTVLPPTDIPRPRMSIIADICTPDEGCRYPQSLPLPGDPHRSHTSPVAASRARLARQGRNPRVLAVLRYLGS